LLSGSLSASLSLLKTYFYSLGLRTGSATEWSLPWAAIYTFRSPIRFTYTSPAPEKHLFTLLGAGKVFIYTFQASEKPNMYYLIPLRRRKRFYHYLQTLLRRRKRL